MANVNNANVVRDEMERCGTVKSIETDDDCWHVQFENDLVNFDVDFDIVNGVNVQQVWTSTDVTPHDTMEVNVTFDL